MKKSILITGASRGVGRALAIKCAESGLFNKFVICCRENTYALRETASRMREVMNSSDATITMNVNDIGVYENVQAMYEQTGPVDILVNCAAISYVGLLTEMPPEDWDRIIRTNFSSIYYTCHAYLPEMIRNKSGRIINISSVWGEAGASCEVAYSATKGAMNAFTKALAKEVAPSNIQVNAVALGVIDTEMNDHLDEEEKAALEDEIPAGRMATPAEAAEAIFSVITMPPYLTGEIIKFDGGWI